MGAPVGNRNAETHGFYSRPARKLETIADVVADLLAKQERLSAVIDELEDVGELAKLLALYGQNASRIGRLLRDRRALSGKSADGMLGAIGQALDELSTELGIEL